MGAGRQSTSPVTGSVASRSYHALSSLCIFCCCRPWPRRRRVSAAATGTAVAALLQAERAEEEEEAAAAAAAAASNSKGGRRSKKASEPPVLWLDAFRNGTISSLGELKNYIRKEGSVWTAQHCMWADESAFQVSLNSSLLPSLLVCVRCVWI